MAALGGTKNVEGSANSIEIDNLARFAVEEHNKKEKIHLEFKKVVSARQQEVAGTVYYITIEVTDGGHKKLYEAKIWVKAWQHFKEVQEFKLIPIVGGITDVEGSANSIEIDNLARFAVEEHNKKENALLEFKKVVSARQQLVEGIIYYITIEVTDGGHNKVYEAKIFAKAWENFKEVQEFKLIGDAPTETSA